MDDSDTKMIDACGNYNGTHGVNVAYGDGGVFNSSVKYPNLNAAYSTITHASGVDVGNLTDNWGWAFFTNWTAATNEYVVSKGDDGGGSPTYLTAIHIANGSMRQRLRFVANATEAVGHSTLAQNDGTLRPYVMLRNYTGSLVWFGFGRLDNKTVTWGQNYDVSNARNICTGAYCGEAPNKFAGNIDTLYLFEFDGTADLNDSLTNFYDYGNFSGLASGCNFSWAPSYPIVNETTAQFNTSYYGAVAPGNYYWNFSYSGTEYFTNTTQNATQSFNYSGNWNTTLVCTIGGVNYTESYNVSVNTRPVANWTIGSTYPYMADTSIQFNDTSTDPDGDAISAWWWDFGDGNTTSPATQNATNTYILPGEYTVSLIVQDARGANSSSAYSDNITINGFALDVFNEKTAAAVTCWDLTISNATYALNFSCQNNTFLWYNFTSFPTGTLTLGISASGYVSRTYYAYYNVGYYVNLDAYLLDTYSGVYPIFNVVNTSYVPLEGALVSAYRTIGATSVLVSQLLTDSVGAAQMYLDPTATHTIITTLSGYNPDSSSITPTATNYLIMLTKNASYNYFNISDTFFIVVQPHAAELEIGVDNITTTIHDPYNNLNFWNVTTVNQTGDLCDTYYSTTSSGGIYSVNSSAFTCTVAAGTRVFTSVHFDRNTSSPYYFNATWWNEDFNYSTYSLASVFDTAPIKEDYREFIAVAATLAGGVMVGGALGSGAGALVMLAIAVLFSSQGWISVMWVAMAILMGLGAYVYSVRGGGAVQ